MKKRTCIVCGKELSKSQRYGKQRTCSRECGNTSKTTLFKTKGKVWHDCGKVEEEEVPR